MQFLRRAGSVQVETLELTGPLSIPCWARDRTENRIPLFLIALEAYARRR
jgi:hypothetical protein